METSEKIKKCAVEVFAGENKYVVYRRGPAGSSRSFFLL